MRSRPCGARQGAGQACHGGRRSTGRRQGGGPREEGNRATPHRSLQALAKEGQLYLLFSYEQQVGAGAPPFLLALREGSWASVQLPNPRRFWQNMCSAVERSMLLNTQLSKGRRWWQRGR